MTNDVSGSEFPRELALVPESQQTCQTFGWGPATWAFGLLVFSSIIFVQPAKPQTGEYVGSAISALLAVFLLVFEFRRRKNPAILVRRVEGNVLGIYKRRLLDRTVSVNDVGIYLRHPGATWGPIIGLSSTTIIFAIFAIPGPPGLSTADHVLALLASLIFAAFAGTVIRTRLQCDELLLPRKNGKGIERILVRTKAIKLLLSRR